MKPWFPHSSIWPRWLRILELRIRMKVFKQNSYLIDNWKVLEGEMEVTHGLDLEERLVKTLTEEIENDKNKKIRDI